MEMYLNFCRENKFWNTMVCDNSLTRRNFLKSEEKVRDVALFPSFAWHFSIFIFQSQFQKLDYFSQIFFRFRCPKNLPKNLTQNNSKNQQKDLRNFLIQPNSKKTWNPRKHVKNIKPSTFLERTSSIKTCLARLWTNITLWKSDISCRVKSLAKSTTE